MSARDELATELQRHEMDLWAILDPEKFDASLGSPDERGGRIAERSWCKCGAILDNDAGEDGWPSMAKHQADAILAAGLVHPELAVCSKSVHQGLGHDPSHHTGGKP